MPLTFGNVKRIALSNTAEELKCAILKSQQWLAKDKKARIGLVVPALAEQRALVIRILSEAFKPNTFNVAAPIPLRQYPLIDSALLVLSFFREITIEALSRFLRSPFFKNASREQNIRAALDVRMRRFSETVFTLEDVVTKMAVIMKKEAKLSHWTGFSDLQKWVLMRTKIRGKQRASLWRDQFLAMLHDLGWPGDRVLIPEELEIIEQWQKVLSDYVAMDRVLGEHRYGEAVFELQKLLQNTAYAPSAMANTPASAPIQVLGILEALGMPFDYLWVSGLSREAWPPQPLPNPFIPLSLQREYDLPQSSAAQALKMARQWTARLSQGGQEVIFSYPQRLEDRPVSVSGLIADIPEISLSDLGIARDRDVQTSRPLSVEKTKILDNQDHAPPVEATETLKGGSQILKLQALCPFRAFAEIRLQAKPMPQQSLGLNAAQRGEIIHQILAYFWEDLRDQSALLALPSTILDHRIHAAIDKIFLNWQARYPKTLTPHYLKLEKKRTYALIEAFIALEKKRPDFAVVSTEKKRVVCVEGLEMQIRIDRIDRVENQSELVIDYKTGQVSLGDWFSERLKEPQLPLYCLTEAQKTAGLVFGLIRPDAIKYQGLVAKADLLPGVKTPEKAKSLGCAASFSEQCDVWRQSISRLAREFMQGLARVQPLEGENTCKRCSLKPLCRIHSSNPV